MKYTPGPWEVEVLHDTTNIQSKYQTVACDVSNCDADLIAAAPEMLEELKLTTKGCSCYGNPQSACTSCLRRYALIAKAEGVKK